MGSLLVELLPFAVGLAVTPAAIAATILFLASKRRLGNAIAFAAAFSVVYTAISLAVLAAAQASAEPLVSERTRDVLTLAVGLLLLGLAAITLVRGRRPRRAGWTSWIDTATPGEAFVLGLVLATVNPNVPILLASLATIAAAGVPGASSSPGWCSSCSAPRSGWPARSSGSWSAGRRGPRAGPGQGVAGQARAPGRPGRPVGLRGSVHPEGGGRLLRYARSAFGLSCW